MRLHIYKKNSTFLETFELPLSATVDDLKKEFFLRYHFYEERQAWRAGTAGGPLLGTGALQDYGVSDNTCVYFKDMGVQISWRLVYVLEYLGPLVVFPLYYFGGRMVYGTDVSHSCTQRAAFYLLLFHYVKREVESLFVHRFSKLTMPITRLPLNCLHYWGVNGILMGYFLFHPNHESLLPPGRRPVYLVGCLMMVFELLNLKTHIVLRELRGSRTSNEKGIPHGWGFDLVSCANYLWEILAWAAFGVLTNVWPAWLFLVVSTVQMVYWARKKHRNYRNIFKDYPLRRKAIIPFVI